MNYCIVNDENIIENIIVCESDEVAAQFGALPSYDGATIGEAYNPPPPPPTTEERVAALEAASDRLDAQATYTAMMTDTLMEG
jgi:hypothetical protein